MCVRDIEFTYLYDFSIECWNCSVLSQVIFFSPKSGKIIYLCENLDQKYLKKKMFCINTDLVNSINELKTAK
jgi:hypothetical protein